MTSRIPYEIVRSERRTLALTVAPDGTVRVRSPRWLPEREIERFVTARGEWLARKRDEALARGWEPPAALTDEERARAHALFPERLHACWTVFGRPGEVMPKLRLRTMRSRWGSLSPAGAMTLNTMLVRAPLECLDAVIYHELCHLRVRDHGPGFYRELARYVPEWRQRRAELRGRL
ncbi:MAG: YgjP-like metallopeptidase domain-containing protein [Coriobacteriia bacterium]|nr:YgjP-like metallopeptidase domain-containing protein [Coriobacteriia bacterium]